MNGPVYQKNMTAEALTIQNLVNLGKTPQQPALCRMLDALRHRETGYIGRFRFRPI